MRTVILISFLFLCWSTVHAQTVQLNELFGKTWQVDEFYVDSLRVDSTDVLTLQFVFQPTNQFSISGVLPNGRTNPVQGTWAINSEQTQLTLTSSDGTGTNIFEIVYLDENVFAFVIRTINTTNEQQVICELRLRPVG